MGRKRSLRDRAARHDHYYRRARAEGYAARAVYKLGEIDRRFRLLRAGDRVLDLGCAPGSWMQYAAERVGPAGRVVGIDRLPVTAALPPHARARTGDVTAVGAPALLGDLAAFDVVLSDMAPDTTGVRVTDQARSAALVSCAVALARETLAPGGRLCAKVLDGPDVPALRRAIAGMFERVEEVRPPASRAGSRERYLVGIGRR